MFVQDSASKPTNAFRPITVQQCNRMFRRSPLFTASAAIFAAGLMTACGGNGAGDAEKFCGQVQANAAALTQPNLQYSEDIEPLLNLYRSIGELAPLAIEPEWDQLTTAYETASTVVPGDPESEQAALAVIFSTEKSAAAIDRWLEANCAVDIGPVFTIVAQNG